MKKTNEDTVELLQRLDMELSNVKNICKASSHAMVTSYVEKMPHEEIGYIFDGLIKLIEPIQEEIWDLSEMIENGK